MTEPLRLGLYVVATPIGSLDDLSPRAGQILSSVDLIAAEDTRHTQKLLQRHAIHTPMLSFYQGNEVARSTSLLDRLLLGQSIALVSSAGTPLISDPGYRLVRSVREAKLPVFTVPGPSALTAALSVAGLATHRVAFEGFLPAREKLRLSHLQSLAEEARTMVFFEAPHRLLKTLTDMARAWGTKREMVILRELSKYHETAYSGTIDELTEQVRNNADMSRGEIVLVVSGATPQTLGQGIDEENLIRVLADELSPAAASRIAARLTGHKRTDLYQRLLRLKEEGD